MTTDFHCLLPDDSHWRPPDSRDRAVILLDGALSQVATRQTRELAICTAAPLPSDPDLELVADRARALVWVPPSPLSWAGDDVAADELTVSLVWEVFFATTTSLAHRHAVLPLLGHQLGLVRGAAVPEPVADPVDRALAHMDSHLDGPLTLADIAAAADVTRRQLLHLFRKRFDRGPIQILTDRRMARATRYLEETDMTISQIAHSVGYADLPSFSHAYRRQTGIAPSAHRDRFLSLL